MKKLQKVTGDEVEERSKVKLAVWWIAGIVATTIIAAVIEDVFRWACAALRGLF